MKYAPAAVVRQTAIFPILILVAFAIVVIPGLRSHPSTLQVAFTIAFTSFGLWVLYALLFRVPYELVMHDGTISWRTKLRSGSTSIAEIQSVRPYQFAGRGIEIDFKDGRTLIVLIRPGFNAFADQLALWVRPGVVVDLGEGRRLGE